MQGIVQSQCGALPCEHGKLGAHDIHATDKQGNRRHDEKQRTGNERTSTAALFCGNSRDMHRFAASRIRTGRLDAERRLKGFDQMLARELDEGI